MKSIEARNIWKSRRGQQVLAGAELVVNAKEAVGLFGSSGSGKSTLFNILLGVIPPDRGSVYLDGRRLEGLPTDARARLGLGYVPQRPSIPPQLTVSQALDMATEGAGVPDTSRMTEIVMRGLGIAAIAQRPLGRLSGGERRRVEIGYVLVTKPRYLLLDEPFTGLDPLAIDALIVLLRQIVRAGVGVLLAEHNREDAARLVDRYYVLDNGHLAPRPHPADLIRRRHGLEQAR